MNNPKSTFMKSCKIENGQVQFCHLSTDYRLTSPCFKGLEGLTVLIDGGFAVFRSEKKIGYAFPVAAN